MVSRHLDSIRPPPCNRHPCTVFENHRKSLMITFFEWTKSWIKRSKRSFWWVFENLKLAVKKCYQTGQKRSILASFENLKLAVKECYHRGYFLIGRKKDKNCFKMPQLKNVNATFLSYFPTMWQARHWTQQSGCKIFFHTNPLSVTFVHRIFNLWLIWRWNLWHYNLATVLLSWTIETWVSIVWWPMINYSIFCILEILK